MNSNNRFVRFVGSIGARREVACAAPTQVVAHDEKIGKEAGSDRNVTTYSIPEKDRLLDRWLDRVVEFSGSEFCFFFILIGLLIWAFLGIPYGKETNWQVGISDIQAILNLVFDSFLMRQQLNTYAQSLLVSCCLRSRTITHKRMLRALNDSRSRSVSPTPPKEPIVVEKAIDSKSELPPEILLGRICTRVADWTGHIVTVIGYWICIFIWIGFGHYCGWTSEWMFYINSATSALMVFMLAFLANIRERHTRYWASCLNLIYTADTTLELKLRTATGDAEPNEMVMIPAQPVSRVQRCIDFYADLVGTLLGIALLVLVLVIWAVIGPAMGFNSNWWLLIGTYAGLIGMNDGFVLRNVDDQISTYQDTQADQQALDDLELLDLAGLARDSDEQKEVDNSFSYRLSVKMGDICSHQWTVVIGALSIVVLVVGASAMRWSMTGQLLCNVPPSIIESFFTMCLLTGHNIGDAQRRVDLHNIYLRRLRLIEHVDGVLAETETEGYDSQ